MINSDIEMVDENNVDSCSNINDLAASYHNSNMEEESFDDSSANASDVSSLNASSDVDGNNTNTSSSEESISDIDQEQIDSLEEISETPFSSSVIFPLETIQIIAEQTEIQFNLTEDAANLISEDVSYRIRELLHCSAQFMRHSFRTKLTTKDIFRAMHELDSDLILGHNNALDNETNQAENYYIEVPSANVFVEKESVVDLKKEVARILKNDSQSDQCHRNQQAHSMTFDIEWFHNLICDSDSYSKEKSVLINQYFKKLIETLLASKSSTMTHFEIKNCLKIFYNDLCKNPTVKSLLRPLLYFIRNTLIAWHQIPNHQQTNSIAFHQTRIKLTLTFLNALRSIIRNNEFVDSTLYSKIMNDFADTLLMLCFSPCTYLTFDTYYKLFQQVLEVRSSSAYLFTQLLFKFSMPFTDIQYQLIQMLSSRIKNHPNEIVYEDLINISTIDFSILTIYRFLGFDMCLRYLLPLLIEQDSFFNKYFIDKDISNKKQSSIIKEIDCLIKSEINIVAKLIIKGFGLLLTQKPDDFVTIEQSDLIYSHFSNHFGDSLYCSLNPLIEIVSFHQNRSIWFENLLSFYPRKPKRKPFRVKPIEMNLMENLEKVPNKSHKKKGTGLLESMLSTDTSKMAKNESLSMFTDSLLDSSHKQYKKVFLYQQDFDESGDGSSAGPSLKYLIVFEGKRISPKTEDDEDGQFKKVRTHGLAIPYKNSEWYKLSVNHRPNTTINLPCSKNYNWTKNMDDSIQIINKSKNFNSLRHKAFHYHRMRQHLRTNCSLYTCI